MTGEDRLERYEEQLQALNKKVRRKLRQIEELENKLQGKSKNLNT